MSLPTLPVFEAFTTKNPAEPRTVYDQLEAHKVSHGSNGDVWLSPTTMPPLATPKQLGDDTWLYETSKCHYHLKLVPKIPTGYKTIPAPCADYRVFSALKNWKQETETEMGRTRRYVTGLDETNTEVIFMVSAEFDEYFVGMFISGIRTNTSAVLLK